MEKKKSNLLLNMMLRNGKQKKDISNKPNASSTPIDMSLDHDLGNPTSHIHKEGGEETRRVQFGSSDATSFIPNSSEVPFSWDTFGFPEGANVRSEVVYPHVSQSTPPTRIITPDINLIEQSVLKVEVELSSLGYEVPNPVEYFDRLKIVSV